MAAKTKLTLHKYTEKQIEMILQKVKSDKSKCWCLRGPEGPLNRLAFGSGLEQGKNGMQHGMVVSTLCFHYGYPCVEFQPDLDGLLYAFSFF